MLWIILVYLFCYFNSLKLKTEQYWVEAEKKIDFDEMCSGVNTKIDLFEPKLLMDSNDILVGALLVLVADFWVFGNEMVRSSEMVIGIKEVTGRVVTYDVSWVSRNTTSNQNCISEMAFRGTWGLFLKYLVSRRAFHRVVVDRVCFVWGYIEWDSSELWSIPSKGGGDDTNSFTVFSSHDLHFRVSPLRTRNEAFMDIFTDTYRISGLVLSKDYAYDCLFGLLIMSPNIINVTYFSFCTSYHFVYRSRRNVIMICWKEVGSRLKSSWCLANLEEVDLVPEDRIVHKTYGSFKDSLVCVGFSKAHLVAGIHNMHWMARDEVRIRSNEVLQRFELLS